MFLQPLHGSVFFFIADTLPIFISPLLNDFTMYNSFTALPICVKISFTASFQIASLTMFTIQSLHYIYVFSKSYAALNSHFFHHTASASIHSSTCLNQIKNYAACILQFTHCAVCILTAFSPIYMLHYDEYTAFYLTLILIHDRVFQYSTTLFAYTNFLFIPYI